MLLCNQEPGGIVLLECFSKALQLSWEASQFAQGGWGGGKYRLIPQSQGESSP